MKSDERHSGPTRADFLSASIIATGRGRQIAMQNLSVFLTRVICPICHRRIIKQFISESLDLLFRYSRSSKSGGVIVHENYFHNLLKLLTEIEMSLQSRWHP